MSKPWFAFFKRAAVCVGVSAIIAFSVLAGSVSAAAAKRSRAIATSGSSPRSDRVPELSSALPERTVQFSSRGQETLRVGDTLSYTLDFPGGDPAAEARWGIDPKAGGLKLGFLFRPGRLFTPLGHGELSLPALPIVDEKGEVVARTKPFTITIASNFSEKELSSGEPPKPEPAIAPLGLPFPGWIQSTIGFSILGVFAVGVFFLMRYLRRKAAAALKSILPKKPYDVAALEKMDSLLRQGLIAEGKFKPFYFGISETLKAYFGERFDFDARESTTSELISLLNDRVGSPGLNEALVRRVRVLFETLDPVKFAKAVPTAEEAKELHREARELISTTRKVAVDPIVPERKERR